MAGMGEIVVVSGEWVVGSDTKGAGVKLLTFGFVRVEGVVISGGYVIRVEGVEIGEECTVKRDSIACSYSSRGVL